MSAGDWWTSQNHADQKEWPKDCVHGWAPGNYSCTCRDCGIHYAGDKRSVQCYPCAAKFVPPPRPETPEEIRADRDRLAAELARVRSAIPLDGHDEKLLDAVQCHKDDPVRSVVEWGAIRRTVEYIRAALAQPQDGTTEERT